jgi:TolA-binding protein
MNRVGLAFFAATLLALPSCGGSNVKTDYILAEKLWQQGSYEPAARQFERIFLKDKKGKLGQQALYRSAMTQFLFLKHYPEALRLFTKYLETVPTGPAARDAQLQIGDIYFNKTGQYENAIQHYRKWIKDHPTDPETSEFLYRIGRSQFFLWRFEESIQSFEAVLKQSPSHALAAEAAYQIGMAQLSLAAQSRVLSPSAETGDEATEVIDSSARHQLAVKAFEMVERQYPGSPAAQEAALGVVTSLEERGLWEDAIKKLGEMGGKYPIPQILKIRAHRIQERIAKRTTSSRR